MRTVVTIMLSFWVLAVQAKEDCKYYYFRNHKVAAKECYDDNRFGKAYAYNLSGKVIFEKGLRKVGGHETVLFSFYPNGAVSKAEWHSAPDAGIQWYSSVTTFDSLGNQTSYMEDSYDHGTKIMNLPPAVPTKNPAQQPKQIVKCAEIWVSELWCVNTTEATIVVHADKMNDANEHYAITLKRGDSAKLVSMPLAQMFDDPTKYYIISVNELNKDQKRIFRIGACTSSTNIGTTRRYYCTIGEVSKRRHGRGRG